MKEITTLSEANQVLARFVPNSRAGSISTYTLDNMHKLMDLLDHPEAKLKIVHVAGTSGKTSTSYYIASLLMATGKKVGLTVSPHVSSVNERLQINLMPLAEAEFCAELTSFLKLIETSGLQPSYFELLMAFAYWEFARQNVDYAVVEVGLGGLLDCSNVAERADKVCVITDIGLDHINILGNSLAEIAQQKAGIIKSHNVVLAYQQSPEVNTVFRRTSKLQKASLKLIKPYALDERFNFLPLFQKRNFGLAKVAVDYVTRCDNLAPLTLEQELQAAKILIPGRMETFKLKDKTVIVDGAHNSQKLGALINSLKDKYPNQPVAGLVSFVDGRSYRLESSIKELSGFLSYVIITAFTGGQDLPYGAVKPEVLEKLFKQNGLKSQETIANSTEALTVLLARPESTLLVTGSFYLLDNIRHSLLEQS